jgi:hypothetical protein
VVTAFVFAAWQIPGSSTNGPGTGTNQKHRRSAPARQLVLRGVGRGTYVEVRRSGPSGKVEFQGTIGGVETKLAGDRFYLLVRRPAGLQVTLDGRAVALPARHNLRVRVTPKRTTLLRR